MSTWASYEDGKVRRVRMRLPRRVFNYGEFLPFMKILEELSMSKILPALLPEPKAYTPLTLVLNRTVSLVAMSNLRTWYGGTYLSTLYGDLPLSSQSLSGFLERIGKSRLPQGFSQRLIGMVGDGSPLLHDITMLSSSSKINLLEYGYHRDGLALPQLSLSLLHREKGIPLFFDVYPGSIVDVSTHRNTTVPSSWS